MKSQRVCAETAESWHEVRSRLVRLLVSWISWHIAMRPSSPMRQLSSDSRLSDLFPLNPFLNTKMLYFYKVVNFQSNFRSFFPKICNMYII